MTEPRWTTERVLEIGRNFQNEDKWHGAHWDTVKLLCDKIEELRDELKKHNRNCERFFNKSGEISALAKSFDAYNAEERADVHTPCWGWAYWLFSETKQKEED